MRTSTTRIGNGAGKGPGYGPGAGPSAPPFTADNQPAPEAKSAGKEVAAEIKAKIAEHKDAILNAQLARAKDTAHPQGHAAAEALLNRIMPPTAQLEHTHTRATISAEPLTEDEWLAAHGDNLATPGGASEGTH